MIKKLFCCPAQELFCCLSPLFCCLPPLFSCLPLWTTGYPEKICKMRQRNMRLYLFFCPFFNGVRRPLMGLFLFRSTIGFYRYVISCSVGNTWNMVRFSKLRWNDASIGGLCKIKYLFMIIN